MYIREVPFDSYPEYQFTKKTDKRMNIQKDA